MNQQHVFSIHRAPWVVGDETGDGEKYVLVESLAASSDIDGIAPSRAYAMTFDSPLDCVVELTRRISNGISKDSNKQRDVNHNPFSLRSLERLRDDPRIVTVMVVSEEGEYSYAYAIHSHILISNAISLCIIFYQNSRFPRGLVK